MDQGVNMFVSAVQSDILTWESMETIASLKWPVEELQFKNNGYLLLGLNYLNKVFKAV